MPPIHCVSARQNWMPCGSDAGNGKMDAPVVVRPETVSKMAAIKLQLPLKKYGSAPNTLSAIQHSATQTKPSRVWSRALSARMRESSTPTPPQISSAYKKALRSTPPSNTLSSSGGIIQSASIQRMTPTILRIRFWFIMKLPCRKQPAHQPRISLRSCKKSFFATTITRSPAWIWE